MAGGRSGALRSWFQKELCCGSCEGRLSPLLFLLQREKKASGHREWSRRTSSTNLGV